MSLEEKYRNLFSFLFYYDPSNTESTYYLIVESMTVYDEYRFLLWLRKVTNDQGEMSPKYFSMATVWDIHYSLKRKNRSPEWSFGQTIKTDFKNFIEEITIENFLIDPFHIVHERKDPIVINVDHDDPNLQIRLKSFLHFRDKFLPNRIALLGWRSLEIRGEGTTTEAF